MYARFEPQIQQLNQQVLEQAGQRPTAELLMTHSGVGPITALATDVFLSDPKRFSDGKALASYIGIIPKGTLQRRATAVGYNETWPHRAPREKTPHEFANEIAAGRDFIGMQTAENSP